MAVLLSPAARAEVAALPKTIRLRMRAMFVELERWPEVSGAKPLRGALAGWYRKRTGDYRVLFRVRGDDALIEKVGHLRDVYEE